MDYPKFRAAEVITSFLLEDCAQVALQYFWFEESFKRHEFALADCFRVGQFMVWANSLDW